MNVGMRRVRPLLTLVFPIAMSCASTPSAVPGTQPLDRDSKNHETTGGPVATKAPSAGGDKSTESSAAGDDDASPKTGTADVSYEDALKNAESKASDEGIMMSECGAVGGSLAMGCQLEGSGTAKFLVQDGVVKGVTVVTDPHQPDVVKCMQSAIADIAFRKAKGPTGCVRTFKLSGGK
jgi:hypothetical protein